MSYQTGVYKVDDVVTTKVPIADFKFIQFEAIVTEVDEKGYIIAIKIEQEPSIQMDDYFKDKYKRGTIIKKEQPRFSDLSFTFKFREEVEKQ